MRLKHVIVFLVSAGAFFLISAYRFGDSGHAIGMISRDGGTVRHPVHIQNKFTGCTVIVTARVIPPYHGDARVVLEGAENISYNIYLSEPVINIGINDRPRFDNNILYGLKPGVSIAMWVVMEDIDNRKNNRFNLAFYDTKTKQSVLEVPVLFEQKEAERNGSAEECH